MTTRRSSLPGLFAVLAACATDAPGPVPPRTFDASAGTVEIVVLGDGFVRSGDRRLPLELMVLELRQRTRAMAREDLQQHFVVHVSAEPQPAGSATARRAQQGVRRLTDELQIMGVRQVKIP